MTAEYNQEHGKNYDTNIEDIIPYQFGISGHEPDGVVDVRNYYDELARDPASIGEASQKLKALMNASPNDNIALKIDRVAQKIMSGETLLPEERGTAAALAYQYLEDSGQLARMVAQAKGESVAPISPDLPDNPVIPTDPRDEITPPPLPVPPTDPAYTPVDLSGVQAVLDKGGLLSRRHGNNTMAEKKAIQEFLKANGYTALDGSELEVDGILGPDSTHAIKQFQRDQGLTDDGVVGGNTLGKMHEVQLERLSRESAAFRSGVEQATTGMLAEYGSQSAGDTLAYQYTPGRSAEGTRSI